MHKSSVDLVGIDVCYCDSEAAWRIAVERGLPSRAVIRTSNPNLLQNPPRNATVEQIERSWTPSKIEALSASTDGLVMSVRRAVSKTPFNIYADLLARDAFLWNSRLPWATTLDDRDMTEPRAVISVEHESAALNSRSNSHWMELLAGNPRLVQLKLSANECGLKAEAPLSSPTRLQLMKFYPASHLEYTFWRLLWRGLPRHLSRGTIYIGADNPGIRETVIHFARRGYAICETDRPRMRAEASTVPDGLRQLIASILRDHLQLCVKPNVSERLIDLFFSDFVESLAGFDGAAAQWSRVFAAADRSGEKIVAFLSNIILPTVLLPLRASLSSRRIPLVLFQHGHSRELTRYLEFNKCISEETFADLFICYDDKANEFASANPHRRSEVLTAGVPALYHLDRRHIADDECGDICYVQTALPVSNKSSPFTLTWTDLEKEQFETKLLNRSLSGLPHRVTVKPYLAADYPGVRGSVKVIEDSPNLNLYSKRFDLRYIVGNFRVLITARATSTLGWCLLSKRPLVYLDLPNQYPLWDDAREAVKVGVFYFDMSAPDSFDRLREFLAQPLDAIERQWNERAPARARFVNRFIDSGKRGFGERSFVGIRTFLAASNRYDARAGAVSSEAISPQANSLKFRQRAE